MAQEQTPDQYRAQRIENRRKLAELGYAPYGKAFPRTGNLSEVRAGFEEGKAASVAGRIMTKRRMGKLMFIHLNDGTDAFQVLLKRDVLGEEAYNAAKLLDLGDFIGVHGTLFTTQAGEKTVEVKEQDEISMHYANNMIENTVETEEDLVGRHEFDIYTPFVKESQSLANYGDTSTDPY